MKSLSVVLNGKKLKVKPGRTILEVARSQGVYIPTLCHDDRLKPTGACRVCLVRVEGARSLLPACSTAVRDGMVVDTEDGEVREARRTALALMISDHIGDCVSPCSLTCPANIDIQGYIALVRAGKYHEAVALIKEKNPLPLTIGRVCPHPCEAVCRRSRVDEAVAINNLKRFAADRDIADRPHMPAVAEKKGMRVAVIGSGPAGLSAAYYLAVRGYDVTLFERCRAPGGMLRYGIPAYRLPKDVLDREIELILDLGIELRCGTEFGTDVTLSDLKREKYGALFLGIGAWSSTPMRIEGEEEEGVLAGIRFLADFAEGTLFDFQDRRVAVVGGGNTAMDASRTALRLGAREVVVLYRRTRAQMPANGPEIDEAEEEGVELRFLTAPTRIERVNHDLRVECIRMELGTPDESGRRRPVPIDGSGYALSTDFLIMAIGQRPDVSCVEELSILTERDFVDAEREGGKTRNPFIYAAGDCVTGAATVIEAIAGGRKAAEAIDRTLTGGRGSENTPSPFNISRGELSEVADDAFGGYAHADRVTMSVLSAPERIEGFQEIEKGIGEEQAVGEASRCLECGCIEGFTCLLRNHATDYSVAEDDFPGEKNRFPARENMRDPSPILRDENKCIKCGICVRICSEVWGLDIYGFQNRGFETEVAPYFDLDLDQTACDFCGQCADACPTGALALNTPLAKPGPFETDERRGTCHRCSLGCELVFHTYARRVMKTSGIPMHGENEGNLCVRGRFGYREEGTNGESCFVTDANGTTPIERGIAIDRAVDMLRKSGRTGIITSTDLSNEEYEGIHRLAASVNRAEVFHVPVDTVGEPLSALSRSPLPLAGRPRDIADLADAILPASLSHLASAGAILLFNTRPGRHYPILEMKIRHAAQAGVPLYIVGKDPLRLDRYARGVFRISPELFTQFFDTVGSVRGGARPGGGTHDYYVRPMPDGSVPRRAGMTARKIAELARAISDKTCVYIADEDETEEDALRAFLMNPAIEPESARLILMRKGMNPLGAIRIGGGTDTRLDPEELNRYDTLVSYRFPLGEAAPDLPGVQFDSDFPRVGREGVYIPINTVSQTGGTRDIYDGRRKRNHKVFEKNPRIDNNTTLKTITSRLDVVDV